MEKKHSHLKNIRDQRDRELIQDMLRNFENGYSRVVELYMSQLLSVARNALEGTGLLHLSEDVVQETLISAYIALQRKQAERPDDFEHLYLRAYLYTIARNNATKLHASKLQTSSSLDALSASLESILPPGGPDPAASYEIQETLKDIGMLMQTLSPIQQAILTQKYITPTTHDVTLTQIAHDLGKPKGTIQSEHQRSLKRMRHLCAKNNILPLETHA